MDEPLSNLDAKLRVQMRSELKRFHKELNATVIYVTHDQLEAMTMSIKIAVMSGGRLQQYGSPDEICNGPVNTFVAGFVGSPSMNLLRGAAEQHGDSRFVIGPDYRIGLNDANWARIGSARDVIVGCHPGDVKVTHEPSEMGFKVAIHTVEPTEDLTYLHLRIGGSFLVATVAPFFQAAMDDEVWLNFDNDRLHLFDATTDLLLPPVA